MPYAQGAYSTFSTLPSEPRPLVGASRKIDFTGRRYVFDDTTGAFEHMSTLAQNIALATAYAVPRGGSITPQEQERTRHAIATAIAPFSKYIANVVITVERARAGVESRRVEYTDLSTGLNEKVQLS